MSYSEKSFRSPGTGGGGGGKEGGGRGDTGCTQLRMDVIAQ